MHLKHVLSGAAFGCRQERHPHRTHASPAAATFVFVVNLSGAAAVSESADIAAGCTISVATATLGSCAFTAARASTRARAVTSIHVFVLVSSQAVVFFYNNQFDPGSQGIISLVPEFWVPGSREPGSRTRAAPLACSSRNKDFKNFLQSILACHKRSGA